MVTSSIEEIKVWRFVEFNQYKKLISIEIDEEEEIVLALSEEGHLLAYTGNN